MAFRTLHVGSQGGARTSAPAEYARRTAGSVLRLRAQTPRLKASPRHPDKTRLAELRQAVAEKLKAIESLKNELMTMKAKPQRRPESMTRRKPCDAGRQGCGRATAGCHRRGGRAV